MSFFTRFSLKNISAVVLLCILIMAGGIYSSYNLKKETMPDVSIPIVAVITVYPGASPGDVQDKVTKLMEEAVSGVAGIKKYSSTSSENVSTVIAQFDYSANMEEAQRKVEDAIKGVGLPDGAITPKIMRIDFGAFPVMSLSVSSSSLSPGELAQVVKEKVIPGLSGISGVGKAEMSSDAQKAVYVKLKPEKLNKYNLTLQTVIQLLRANNISFPSGAISLNETVEPVRVYGKVNSLDELKNLRLPVIPNIQDTMKSTLEQIGGGMDSLGQAVGQMGQGLNTLGKTVGSIGQGMSALSDAVGEMGQGMTGMNQAFSAQIQLISAIQDLQGQLFGARMAIAEANLLLKDPTTDKADKEKAQLTVAQLGPKIQILEAALVQAQTKLKEIQKQISENSGTQGSGTIPNRAVNNTTGKAAGIIPKQGATTTAGKIPKQGATTTAAAQSGAKMPAGNTNASAAGNTGNASNTGSLETVTLQDVADIYVDTGSEASFSRTNGSPSVIIQILKTQDANIIDVSDAVRAKLADIKKTLPDGTNINSILDQADYVKESISGMLKEGFLGAIFAFLVILLFLPNFRTTIIASVSIPLSVLITLLFLRQINITLNIITLGGLSVAVGRIVDDSIVVIENIYRHLQSGEARTSDLLKIATKEVSSAITSSTLTTVAVFLPMAFVGGIAGLMFKPFALTVTVALISSLLVAVTVIPALSAFLLLKSKKIKQSDFHEGRTMRFYESILLWSLKHKFIVLLTAITLFAGSLSLYRFVGTSFMSEEKEKYVSITMEYPPGTDVKVVNKKAIEIEKILNSEKGISIYQTTVGSPSAANSMNALSGKGDGSFLVKLEEKTDLDSFVGGLRSKIKPDNEKSRIMVNQTNVSSTSGSGGMNNLEVLITGSDFEKVKASAVTLTKELTSIKGLENVTNNLSESKPEILISINQKKVSEYGLSAAQAGMAVRELLNDTAAGTILFNNKTMDIKVGLLASSFGKLTDVGNIEISSPAGKLLKVSDIAEVKQVAGPVSIYSEDGKECAKVTAKITEKNTGSVSDKVTKKMNSISIPDGVTLSMGGVTKMMNDTFRDLILAMIVAVFAVFFVMLIALGEAVAPLAILFSLPLAVIGGLLALFITKLPIDMPSMVGALMLIGIVVTNAIVLIDRVQQRRRDGMNVRDALMEAGRIRMRPILMTAIATIAALIPLASGVSKGSIMSQSLAVIVIGGLTTSTFLTLVIVPVAYEMLVNLKARLTGNKAGISG